jgi:hypothetical protein
MRFKNFTITDDDIRGMSDEALFDTLFSLGGNSELEFVVFNDKVETAVKPSGDCSTVGTLPNYLNNAQRVLQLLNVEVGHAVYVRNEEGRLFSVFVRIE